MAEPRTAECVGCGALKKIRARNLCRKCYNLWLDANPERAWQKTAYPSDEELVKRASTHRTMKALADELGVSREAFRDYLQIRPSLDKEVRRLIKKNMDDTQDEAISAAKARWRKANPDKVREINRRWAKNQDPAKRSRWNNYNRERRRNAERGYLMTEDDLYFCEIIRRDPCSYCSRFGRPTSDHIIPVVSGGTSEWMNLAGACQSCNSSKNDEHLLKFMLRRALETDALKKKECSNG